VSGANWISFCAVKITAFRRFDDGEETGKSLASGFFWRKNDQVFLITNWHNVTGINPLTGENIGSFTPTHFNCDFKYGPKNKNYVQSCEFTVRLFDEKGNPNWIEHPKGKLIDVVAIPFEFMVPENQKIHTLDEQKFEARWFPSIGDDSFVVGFPEGFSGGGNTPIWKRGSVATEPTLNFNSLPMFLLDTIGNAGLSGSPVIGRASGAFGLPGKKTPEYLGTWDNFAGIYSGRISSDGIGSQMGRVWKSSVLNEIFDSISS